MATIPGRSSAGTTVAAGVTGIVLASIHILWSGMVLVVGLLVLGVSETMERTPGSPLFPVRAVLIVLAVAGYVTLSAAELVVAIQVLRRRAWARPAALGVFGGHAAIGLLGLLVGPLRVMAGLTGMPGSRSNSLVALLGIAVVVLLLVPLTVRDFERDDQPPRPDRPDGADSPDGYAVLVPGQDLSRHLPPGLPPWPGRPGHYGPPARYPYSPPPPPYVRPGQYPHQPRR